MKTSGFTIKELAMVLVVISLLCIASIPQFYTMRTAHRRSEANETIERVKTALQAAQTQASNPIVTIESLDNEPSGQPCVACFTIAYDKGLKNALWLKSSNQEYIYAIGNNPETPAAYNSAGNVKLKFDKSTHQVFVEEIK